MAPIKQVKYTVEKIDIDGDGIPDGDLVTQWNKDGTRVNKFVPYKQLKQAVMAKAKEAKLKARVNKRATFENTNMFNNSNSNANANATTTTTRRSQKLVYKTMPDMNTTDKPVVVQDGTSLSQYFKQGVGFGAGMIAVETVFDGIKSLFE